MYDSEEVAELAFVVKKDDGDEEADLLILRKSNGELVKIKVTSVGEVGTTGPQGEPGDPGPSGIGMATFGMDGPVAVKVGTARWTSVGSTTITGVLATVGTPPAGASIIVDVKKNGTTVFTTTGNRPTIAAAANSSGVKVPDVTALADGDYLTVDVVQVGSTTSGSDLTVEIVLT